MPMYAGSEMVIPYLGNKPIRNQDKTIIENGEYTSDQGYTGLGKVTVNVSSSASGTINITENGTYNVTQYANADVNVEGGEIRLQEKIARQNGLVEPDSGYNGLSSVDVGVGQIGETYQALNLTNSSILENDKVWLLYRGLITNTFAVGWGSWYGNYPPLPSINGDFVIYDRSYGGSGWNLNSINDNGSTLLQNFTWWNRDYDKFSYYDPESLSLIVMGGSNIYSGSFTSNLELTSSGDLINTQSSRKLGYGFYITSSNIRPTIYDKDGNEYIMPDGTSRPYCVYKRNNNFYLLTNSSESGSWKYIQSFIIDTINYTLTSEGRVNLNGSQNYFNGVTEDGKYAFFYDCIVDLVNYQKLLSIDNITFNPYLFRTPYNYLSKVIGLTMYNNYAGNSRMLAYDTNNGFTEITNEFTQPSTGYGAGCPTVTGINRDRIFYHLFNYTNSNACYCSIVQKSESYIISNFSGASESSITGYAAENIGVGSTGDVIVGTAGVNDSLTIIPSTSQQTFTAQNGHGFSPITVNAVTSDIDQNISPENIKKNISILGVEGNYEGDNTEIITAKNLTDSTIIANTQILLIPYNYKNWQNNSTISGTGPTSVSSDGKDITFSPSGVNNRSICYFNNSCMNIGYNTSMYIKICFSVDDVFNNNSYVRELGVFGTDNSGQFTNNTIALCLKDNKLGFYLPGNNWLYTNYTSTNVPTNTTIYVKLEQDSVTNNDIVLSTSTDGSVWTECDRYTYPTGTNYQLYGIYYHLMWNSVHNYGNSVTFKADKCQIHADMGNTWYPYINCEGYGITEYIQNRTDIISGITQEDINSGFSGNVKILKPIN